MFFLSLFLILILGVLIFYTFKRLRLPSLIGYLLVGILLARYNLIDPNLLALSSEIRKLALIIILLKAGLSLSLKDLKKVGRPAICLSFIPAVVEMVTIGVLGPHLFDLTYVESFLLGSVIGAVSPAVVIPRMTRFIDERRGIKKGIPQMIIAGSSVDDIVMLVFFSVFITMVKGNSVSLITFFNVPIAIIVGILIGIVMGYLVYCLLLLLKLPLSLEIVFLLGISLGLTYLESILPFSYASLLSIIVIGLILFIKNKNKANTLAKSYNNLWIVAEIFLFTFLGASVKIDFLFNNLGLALILLLVGLCFRMLAVFISLFKTNLTVKERSFVALSYFPKATVQAAIGGELYAYAVSTNNALLLNSGIIILSISVVSIFLTAPLSAIIIDLSYKNFLTCD